MKFAKGRPLVAIGQQSQAPIIANEPFRHLTIAVFIKKGTRYSEIEIKKIHMARAYVQEK